METTLQIAVVGGGAAGFFAAIEAKRRMPEADVTIYEKHVRPLAKVAVTGGGRCNLTNTFAEVTDLRQVYPRGYQVMKRLLKHFSHTDLYEWFEQNGVPLVVQDDQCVFPRSQDSQSVIWCLTSLAKQLGVKLKTGRGLTLITPRADSLISLTFDTEAGGETKTFHRVAITTGGHPRKEGLRYLAATGHTIEPPVPSLFTFCMSDSQLKKLMGTVVEHAITSIPSTKYKACGPLLITHWGMSGPAILKLSSHAARYLHDCGYKAMVSVNWTGEPDASEVERSVREMAAGNTQKQLSSVRPFDIPSRLWCHLLLRAGSQPEKKWGELGKKGISRLVNTLTNDSYQMTDRAVFKEEFVTCGGVSLSDVNLTTMESKKLPGLFFAGEVLDIDAVTGGFNLQAAWTTGFVAGQNMAKKK